MGNEFISTIFNEQSRGIIKHKNKYKCLRCGNEDQSLIVNVPYDSIYCRCCIDSGKVSNKKGLIRKDSINKISDIDINSTKKLTKLQLFASNYVLNNINCGKPIVIWAVCGAGKTEIIYPTIEYSMNNNLNFCWATPRKDIVVELTERFRSDFKGLNLISLYGGSVDRGRNSNFIVSTTHQLVNFYNYFDVIVVDEIDAFPYKNNSMLEYFVKKSLKKDGKLIYLTATPSREIISNINNKKFLKYVLPLRYHGNLLPEPKVKIVANINRTLNINHRSMLFKMIDKVLKEKKKVMIFVPSIRMGNIIEARFNNNGLYSRFIYSNMKDRMEVISEFRNDSLNIIVTTIILERGVTFSNVDVIIIEADHKVFDTSSLIQIAGRVGRKKEYPNGNVFFICSEYNRNIKEAVKQIKNMNRLGRDVKKMHNL